MLGRRLRRLVGHRPVPLLYDCHLHTPFCGHARGPADAYAARAVKRGLKGVFFTCHCPIPGQSEPNIRMSESQLPAYVEWVQRLRQSWQGRLDVRLGLECDYYPGCEQWLPMVLQRAEFEYVIGSVHPHLSYYRDRFWQNDILAYQRLYFEHLAAAAESGMFQALAHPDIIKFFSRGQWLLSSTLEHVRDALDRIAATGVAMELNTSGLHYPMRQFSPGPRILREMAARGVPVVLGSDSHHPRRVADRFERALDSLRDCSYAGVRVMTRSESWDVPLADARASLRGRRLFGFA